MNRFEDKVALVTGAGSGIGLATATRLAEEGARVVAGILDESQRDAVAGFDAQVVDVTKTAHWEAAKSHLEATYGRLDVLVNNAGIIDVGTVEEMREEAWWRVLDVNLASCFRGCKMAVPLMRSGGGEMFRALRQHRRGVIIADLNDRTITFEKMPL